jgi:hypothetical protein
VLALPGQVRRDVFHVLCDDFGKGVFVAVDVATMLTVGTAGTLAFFKAVFRGLANGSHTAKVLAHVSGKFVKSGETHVRRSSTS